MVDQVTVGRRLKEARVNCGFTQEAAAEQIGAPRTAVVHIEAGNRSLSMTELAELAKLYGRSVAEFFSEENGTAKEEDVWVILHRMTPDLKENKSFKQEISHCINLCKEGMNLETILERKVRLGPPAYELPTPENFAQAAEQGEQVAENERNRLGLSHAPISDIADLLSAQGIWASSIGLPEEMSGLFLYHPSDVGFTILVNHNHNKYRGRKRFSYAHEYAHALLDRKRTGTITSKSNANELIEKRANAFAAAFLMPKTGVELFLAAINKGGIGRRVYHLYDSANLEGIEAEKRADASFQEITLQDTAILSAHFGVSYQAALYRLIDLGCINRAKLRELLQKEEQAEQYLKMIGKLPETVSVKDDKEEIIGQIMPLALEAYRRKGITKKYLTDLMGQLGIKDIKIASIA